MDSMFGLIDIIIIICGAYLIYGAIQLRNGGELPSSLWSKDLPMRKCKDREGFSAYMFPRLVISGAAVMIDGILGVLADRYDGLAFLTYITMGLVIVILVWYILFTRKAQKQFF